MQQFASTCSVPSHTLGWGQIFKKKHLFPKVDILHIKLMGMEPRAPYTHARPLGWGQKVKTYFFAESSHVAYQTKWNGT